MRKHDEADAVVQLLNDMIARNTAAAPVEPGVYRMPCGECIVDFFRTDDGDEHWLVPGDPTGYTRETVAVMRHGEFPWERMYTLADAAAEILQRAQAADLSPSAMLAELAGEAGEPR